MNSRWPVGAGHDVTAGTRHDASGTNQPVGNVDVCSQVLGLSVLVQDGADCNPQLRIGRQFSGPVLVAVDVGEGDNLPPLQHQQSVIDAGLAAGG